jgi:hypothetical protein
VREQNLNKTKLMNWTELQITDKTGKVGWKTEASPMSVNSEVKNLMRHVEAIRAKNPAYSNAGFDAGSICIQIDGSTYEENLSDSDLALLDALGL